MLKLSVLKSAALGAVFSVVASAVLALEPCDAVVVDTAGVLQRIPAVETAASELARKTGAEVRVRVAPDHKPQSNLDRHVEAIADSTCSSWTNVEGNRRSNLLIYWVTMNGQVGLYYGDLWKTELRRAWPGILERKMKPLLRDDNLDQAFISAMEETARVIKAATEPASPVVQREVVRETVRVEQREPTDWTPLAWMFGIVAVLVFIFMMLKFVGFPAWQRYSRNRGMREEARGMLAKCYQTFEHLNGPTNRLVNLLGESEEQKAMPSWVNASVFKTWRHELVLLMQDAMAANQAFLALESGPLNEAGTYDEYRAVRNNLEENLGDLKAVAAKLAALEAAIKREEMLSESIADVEIGVQTAEATARAAVGAIRNEGLMVAASDELLGAAKLLMEEAQAARKERRYGDAYDKYQEVVSVAERAAQVAEELPVRRDLLRSQWEALTARRALLLSRGPEAREAMKAMEAAYAPAAYAVVRGNGTEAEKRLGAVPQMAQAIGGLLDKQSWDKAAAALTGAEDVLNDTEALLDSVVAQKQRLDTAAEDTHEEIGEAERSILVAAEFIQQNRSYDNKDRRNRLELAASLCEDAKLEIGQKKPDVLRAYELAARADDLADEVFDQASDEKETDERRRRRAERERKEALAELDSVARYFRNHRSDIDSAAKSRLSTAEQLAVRLRSERDAYRVLELVRQLNDARADAHRKAKSDFEEEEQARARARRRRQQSTSSSYSSPSSWGSTSSSSFGGGSSGFGGGGSGFGGGSSSW